MILWFAITILFKYTYKIITKHFTQNSVTNGEIVYREYIVLSITTLIRLEEWFTSEKTNMCTVRSLALANYLCNHGFKMQKVIDSERNPQYKLFLFEDNKAIRDSITTYLLNREV